MRRVRSCGDTIVGRHKLFQFRVGSVASSFEGELSDMTSRSPACIADLSADHGDKAWN